MDDDAKSWRAMLMAKSPPSELLAWLREDFLGHVLRDMNTPDVRRRIGLYGGDRIPENERNLIDVRNRVSLIAEYEMARVATRLLENRNLNDLFFSYVVANRFPDLELRDSKGNHGIRVEVKCLASIAEEKAANFDTLKKDINPITDFVVVFLWEWGRDKKIVGPGEDESVGWDRAPEFIKVYCFHASSLAHMRDWYWLNRPPKGLGDGYQGFDLRYGVTCVNNVYKEEEGNYGKLMRIRKEDFTSPPPLDNFSRETSDYYFRFQREVVEIGFFRVCEIIVSETFVNHQIKTLKVDGRKVGLESCRTGFVLSSFWTQKDQKANYKALLENADLDTLFVLSDKYNWSEYTLSRDSTTKLLRGCSGDKPKHLKKRLTSFSACQDH